MVTTVDSEVSVQVLTPPEIPSDKDELLRAIARLWADWLINSTDPDAVKLQTHDCDDIEPKNGGCSLAFRCGRLLQSDKLFQPFHRWIRRYFRGVIVDCTLHEYNAIQVATREIFFYKSELTPGNVRRELLRALCQLAFRELGWWRRLRYRYNCPRGVSADVQFGTELADLILFGLADSDRRSITIPPSSMRQRAIRIGIVVGFSDRWNLTQRP